MSKGPGKNFRKGITIKELFRLFPDDATAEAWFVEQRWGDQIRCPHCGSDKVLISDSHKSMPYRCRDYRNCGKRFSVKTGTVMECAKIGYQDWLIATYMLTTSLKSVSSMKLHRELGITQKSAWFLAHRLRKALEATENQFMGPVEVDESYFGGKERNKHWDKKLNAGRGTVGKTAVVGAKDRESNEVNAKVVESTDKETLQEFVHDNAQSGSTVYTDDATAYASLGKDYHHETVNHSAGEYVNEQAHTNGIESFWATLKRAHKGTFHKFSPKHLQRYVDEFSGRHNIRSQDTINQMVAISQSMGGKRLTYKNLIADNGLDSGAR
ncbi:MAG: IS1595 family transposase [Gammaproteobacteria bacterium]|nr:IS1595 family transposase [Gammaproteobacteria bacterium]MYD77650.1 IS1595 family transposase [Gammaproteobacteria bacterium]MYI90129.1 IS1595 family transposase [Gammaproteobacteria bacterium]